MTDESLDPFIEEIASELRRPVRLDSRFDERVMAALGEATVLPLHSAPTRRWNQRRWIISISPLGGLAAAAAVAAIVFAGTRVVRAPGTADQQIAQGPSSVPVRRVSDAPVAPELAIVETQFNVVIPGASSVAVVGDFNDWGGTPATMQKLNDAGLWSVSLPIRAGRHEYQFVVNDSLHITDPTHPQTSSDFGSANSVITVSPRMP